MTDMIHIVCPACHAKNRVPANRLAAKPTCGACKSPLFPGAPFELDEAGLQSVGIDPALVRLAVGVEETDDVIGDLLQALDRV